MATITDQVQEMQGLYGPFTIAERVVQKIWLRQDFDTHAACLLDGRLLKIKRTGAWNLLAGPDFRDARLLLDDREITGDVEVHFRTGDWHAHGHDADPAFDNVALHVVLFPPGDAQAVARSRRGGVLPTLVLLPLLNRGLEEYASDDALENLTARDAAEKLAELSVLPAIELRQRLLLRALARWEQKVHFARLRIDKLGDVGAAHHVALEILGYRHNRAPMLSAAARHPLENWGRGLSPENVHAELKDSWQIQGVRPANHPLRRLKQYAEWVAHTPDWPLRAISLAQGIGHLDEVDSVVQARKQFGLAALRDRFATELTASSLGGTRLDNLVCDGLLPWMAARTGRDFWLLWFNWFVGDVPAEVRRGLVALGLAGRGADPHCHGWAQGLLAWIIEREARASG